MELPAFESHQPCFPGLVLALLEGLLEKLLGPNSVKDIHTVVEPQALRRSGGGFGLGPRAIYH